MSFIHLHTLVSLPCADILLPTSEVAEAEVKEVAEAAEAEAEVVPAEMKKKGGHMKKQEAGARMAAAHHERMENFTLSLGDIFTNIFVTWFVRCRKLRKLTPSRAWEAGLKRCMFPRPTGACQPCEDDDEHCMDCFQMATCKNRRTDQFS